MALNRRTVLKTLEVTFFISWVGSAAFCGQFEYRLLTDSSYSQPSQDRSHSIQLKGKSLWVDDTDYHLFNLEFLIFLGPIVPWAVTRNANRAAAQDRP